MGTQIVDDGVDPKWRTALDDGIEVELSCRIDALVLIVALVAPQRGPGSLWLALAAKVKERSHRTDADARRGAQQVKKDVHIVAALGHQGKRRRALLAPVAADVRMRKVAVSDRLEVLDRLDLTSEEISNLQRKQGKTYFADGAAVDERPQTGDP